MRRSATARLARPPLPPSAPAPEGLGAVRAAVAAATRAVVRKLAAVQVAVPGLMQAATSRRALLSPAFSFSAPTLRTPDAAAAEASPHAGPGDGGGPGLPRSLSGGNLRSIPHDPTWGECAGGGGAAGCGWPSPLRAGPMLSRGLGLFQPLERSSGCADERGGGRAQARSACSAAAGLTGTRASESLGVVTFETRRPGEERPFAQAARAARSPTRPDRSDRDP
jgi:hypothetical protein